VSAPRRSRAWWSAGAERALVAPAQQRIERARRPAARRGLEAARPEQEEGDHADAIEIHLARAGHGRPGAAGVTEGEAEGDRRIEPQAAQAQLLAGAGEERPAGEQQHRGREEQARPAHQRCRLGGERAVVDVGGKGVHHDLHRAEAGDEQAPELRPAATAVELVLAARRVRIGVVAERPHRVHDCREVGGVRIPRDVRPLRGVVDLDAGDARHAREALLDEPQARGAAHPLEDERGLARARRQRQRPPRRKLARRRRGAGTRVVIGVQPGLGDGARHGFAAGAAQLARRPGEGNAVAAGLEHRQAAVEALEAQHAGSWSGPGTA